MGLLNVVVVMALPRAHEVPFALLLGSIQQLDKNDPLLLGMPLCVTVA